MLAMGMNLPPQQFQLHTKLIKGKGPAQHVGGKRIARKSEKAKAALRKGQHLDLQTKLFFSRFEGIYLI